MFAWPNLGFYLLRNSSLSFSVVVKAFVSSTTFTL